MPGAVTTGRKAPSPSGKRRKYISDDYKNDRPKRPSGFPDRVPHRGFLENKSNENFSTGQPFRPNPKAKRSSKLEKRLCNDKPFSSGKETHFGKGRIRLPYLYIEKPPAAALLPRHRASSAGCRNRSPTGHRTATLPTRRCDRIEKLSPVAPSKPPLPTRRRSDRVVRLRSEFRMPGPLRDRPPTGAALCPRRRRPHLASQRYRRQNDEDEPPAAALFSRHRGILRKQPEQVADRTPYSHPADETLRPDRKAGSRRTSKPPLPTGRRSDRVVRLRSEFRMPGSLREAGGPTVSAARFRGKFSCRHREPPDASNFNCFSDEFRYICLEELADATANRATARHSLFFSTR